MKTFLRSGIRAALVATSFSVSGFTFSSAHAAGVAETTEELATPTLTMLHELDSGLYPSPSAYQLTLVPDGEEPDLLNITKYLDDAGTYSPVQYNVVFDEPLGDPKPEGEDYTYFKWQEVIDPTTSQPTGRLELVSTADSSEADIEAYTSLNERFEGDATTTEVKRSFLGLEYSASGEGSQVALGGALSHSSSGDSSQTLDIAGDFVGNSATASASTSAPTTAEDYLRANAVGGAIFLETSSEVKLTGDFVGNSASSSVDAAASANNNATTMGGAIANGSVITSITGDFVGNSASSSVDAAASTNSNATTMGGAIANTSAITSITGDFIANAATATVKGTSTASSSATASAKADVAGGAIINMNTITSVTGDFIGNSASAISYASGFGDTSTVATSRVYGGVIQNGFADPVILGIGSITGDFIGNSTTSLATADASTDATARAAVYGGVISNSISGIGSITGDFMGNSVSSTATTTSTAGSVRAEAHGGVIFNSESMIGSITGDFIGNSAISTATAAASRAVFATGGAISNSNGGIGFLALDRSMQFTGNYISTDGGKSKSYEAIYNGANSTLNFNAYGENSIVVNDGINGGQDYQNSQIININNGFAGNGAAIKQGESVLGLGTSTVAFNSFVNNQSITVHAGELRLGKFAGTEASVDYVPPTQAKLNNTSLTINAGALVSVQGQLELDSSSSITTSTTGAAGQASTIKGLAADSSISGGSLTIADNSSLSIQNITLTQIAISTGANATLSLENITLVYDDAISNNKQSLTRDVSSRSYTLQGLDVGEADITGSLTLDVTMMGSEYSALEDALAGGAGVFFTVEGLEDARFVEGLRVSFNINGGLYQSEIGGGTGGGAQFSLIIPEPSTATLSLLALAGLLARRRRSAA